MTVVVPVEGIFAFQDILTTTNPRTTYNFSRRINQSTCRSKIIVLKTDLGWFYEDGGNRDVFVSTGGWDQPPKNAPIWEDATDRWGGKLQR